MSVGDYNSIEPTIDPRWVECNTALASDPDNFELWEKLIKIAEEINGGINKTSSISDLKLYRLTFDTLLLKFPLLFAYWIKYSKKEFYIGFTENSENLFEKGIESCPCSVDLWTEYCKFKMIICQDDEIIRNLFKRGSSYIGLHYMSHLFWDVYLSFEEYRNNNNQKVFKLLNHIITIPLYDYSKYFQKLFKLLESKKINDFLTKDEIEIYKIEIQIARKQQIQTQSQSQSQSQLQNQKQIQPDTNDKENENEIENLELTEDELNTEIHSKLVKKYTDIYVTTQTAVYKRWEFESQIKRPHFHITYLSDNDLSNWRRYLTFEEIEGDFNRTRLLYERCLITCALYEEFWLRYSRWLVGKGKLEEARSVYKRACFYVPIGRPTIRNQYALFEQMQGNFLLARDIFTSVLESLPGNVETFIYYANLERIISGNNETALALYVQALESEYYDSISKNILLQEIIQLYTSLRHSIDEARQFLNAYILKFSKNYYFWRIFLELEINSNTFNNNEEDNQDLRVRNIFIKIQQSDLEFKYQKDLSHIYQIYLLEHSTSENLKEYFQIDIKYNRSTVKPLLPLLPSVNT